MPRITNLELKQHNAALATENAALRTKIIELSTKPKPMPSSTLTMDQRREYIAAFPQARTFTAAMYYTWKASLTS